MLMRAVDAYLALRRAAGFQLRNTEYLLRDYARFADKQGETHVRAETALTWAALGAPGNRGRRMKPLILFAQHIRAEDHLHEVPPEVPFGPAPERRLPYILSVEDLGRLLHEAGRLGPPKSLRPKMYRMLFGLIAACGLRISEALNLRMDDLTRDGLIIRHTKFRKSRIVPMHETTHTELERYLDHRKRVGGVDDHIFISLRGTVIKYPTVNATFLALVRGLGLHPGPGKEGPRIHDLRHGFAVRALESCPTDQQAISRHMLALATYMGHANIKHTYWYLQTTPLLMTDIADACRAFWEEGDQS